MVTTSLSESSDYSRNDARLGVQDLDAAQSAPPPRSISGEDVGVDHWDWVTYVKNYGTGDWADEKERPPQHPGLRWHADRDVEESQQPPDLVRDFGKIGEWSATPEEVQNVRVVSTLRHGGLRTPIIWRLQLLIQFSQTFLREGYFAAPVRTFSLLSLIFLTTEVALLQQLGRGCSLLLVIKPVSGSMMFCFMN